MLLFVAKDCSQKRQESIELRRNSLVSPASVGKLYDFFNHAQDQRTCVEIHIELLEKIENVLPWLAS